MVEDYREGEAALARGDFTEAIRIWKGLAEAGHARACTALGNLHARGRGVPLSLPRAVHYWRVATVRGDGEGAFRLGCAHQEGRGAELDLEQARRFLRLAAARGFPGARERLEQVEEQLRGRKGAGETPPARPPAPPAPPASRLAWVARIGVALAVGVLLARWRGGSASPREGCP